jgi:hypothetical protein
LYLIYMLLQMADQSIWFLKGIANDIMVKIQDHYATADFMVLDMEENNDSPIILGRKGIWTNPLLVSRRKGTMLF